MRVPQSTTSSKNHFCNQEQIILDWLVGQYPISDPCSLIWRVQFHWYAHANTASMGLSATRVLDQ